MKKTNWKILDGLLKRLDVLFEESGEIFEQEHPWLFDKSIEVPAIVIVPEREQNDMEIQEVLDAIVKATYVEKKEPVVTQTSLLALDMVTNTVV